MAADDAPAFGAGLLKGLFYLVAILLLTALGFSGWVIAIHWGRVGV